MPRREVVKPDLAFLDTEKEDVTPEKKCTLYIFNNEEEFGSVSEMPTIKAEEVEGLIKEIQTIIAQYRNIRKKHWYWFVSRFYVDVEGMTRKEWRDQWRKMLGDEYKTYTHYGRAIKRWLDSGIDYPRSMPPSLLAETYTLSIEDKNTVVNLYREQIPFQEIREWVKSRLSGIPQTVEETVLPLDLFDFIKAKYALHGEEAIRRQLSLLD